MDEKSKYPKITVVTPVFNGEQFIEQTILSVLNQKYPNLEYIIVDGGSTDGTMKIVQKYITDFSVIISERDNGLYDALNKGFAKSSGEIMCYLNADDLHQPNSLLCVAEIFTQFKQVNWLTGTPTGFDRNGICREIYPQRKWSKFQYLLGDYFTIQQESVFWRRSLWDKSGAGFNDKLKLAGDFELWLRFFRTNEKLYSTRSLLGGFRRHGEGQLSRAIDKYSSEVKNIYKDLNLSTEEKKQIAYLKQLQWYNRFPVIRSFMKTNKKIEIIYDFPPEVRFDFINDKYVLK